MISLLLIVVVRVLKRNLVQLITVPGTYGTIIVLRYLGTGYSCITVYVQL